jgi:hypothetical protein
VLVFRSQGSVHCLSAAFAILVSTCSVEDLQSLPLTITKARHDLRCQDRKIGREMRRRPNPDACYLQAVCHAWTNLQIRDLSAPTRQPPHGHPLQISMSNPRRIPAAMETYGDACGKTLNYRSTLSCSHCTPMPVVILTELDAVGRRPCSIHAHTTSSTTDICMPLYRTCPACCMGEGKHRTVQGPSRRDYTKPCKGPAPMQMRLSSRRPSNSY